MKKTILLACAAALFTSCSDYGDGILDRMFKSSGSAVPVTVENVAVSERTLKISARAGIEPSETIEIAAPEEGMVDRVFVAVGSSVQAGDPVAKIVRRPAEVNTAKLRTDMKDAQIALDKTLYILKNRDRLLDEGKIDQSQYDSLEAELATAEANVEKLRQEMNRTPDAPVEKIVNSPSGGIVTSIAAQTGAQISEGKLLASISKTNPVNAVFRLASYESAAVEFGAPVTISVPDLGGEEFSGIVSKIDPALDPENNTFKVWAQVQNPKGLLKAGMYAEAEFTTSQKQRTFLVPEAAVIRDRRKHYVFTVLNGVAHKVEVIPAEGRAGRVEILKGLRDNDLVVVKGHDKLTEGTVVDVWGR